MEFAVVVAIFLGRSKPTIHYGKLFTRPKAPKLFTARHVASAMRDNRDDRRDSEDRRDDMDPDELDDRVAELEERVRTLRDELGQPPEGPLGLPRPPTPREVLSFTGEYAIPTAIATLEANIRALKALQRVIQVLDPNQSAVSEERDRLESRAADASRATLDRLESALEDVETTIRESDLPREDEARSILDDARQINREIRDRVDKERRTADEARKRTKEDDSAPEDAPEDTDADAELDGGTTIELTDAGDGREDGDDRTDDDSGANSVEVDVDAELESIKDEIETRKNASDSETSDDSTTTDEPDSGTDADSGMDADSGESEADSDSGGSDLDADSGDSDTDDKKAE